MREMSGVIFVSEVLFRHVERIDMAAWIREYVRERYAVLLGWITCHALSFASYSTCLQCRRTGTHHTIILTCYGLNVKWS